MKKADIRYLAGLFDGEGCISIISIKAKSNTQNRLYYLQLSINMTDPTPVNLFANHFFKGYKVKPRLYKGQNKKTYYFYTTHNKAAIILKKLYPYLIVKKTQAKLGLKFNKLFRCDKYRGYRKIPKNILKSREKFFYKMRLLKTIPQ